MVTLIIFFLETLEGFRRSVIVVATRTVPSLALVVRATSGIELASAAAIIGIAAHVVAIAISRRRVTSGSTAVR